MCKNSKDVNAEKMNGTIDIVKYLMAILVIGIHTEPFGFNFWLDKGFGIITRLCVPFFFIASSYFFFRKEKAAKEFIGRIVLLYIVWSIIYLPFDINELREVSLFQLLDIFLWSGNDHGLWFLCATIIGFLITYGLLKIMKPRYVLIVALVMLIIGTAKSTYSTAFYEVFGILLPDNLGSRNGLFYGFPYIALGMVIAKSKNQGKTDSIKKLYVGFGISLLMLAIESSLFVIRYNATSTILWLSVFTYSYFFFMIANNTNIVIHKKYALLLRKMSTLLYVSQFLFIPALSTYFSTMSLFLTTVILTTVFSLVIIKVSELRYLGFMKYLY